MNSKNLEKEKHFYRLLVYPLLKYSREKGDMFTLILENSAMRNPLAL